MWERTLQDLVRGLRANKRDEARFIAKAVDEIRQEIKSDDMELKAGAVLKLTYLDMLGYDMSWASFHVVEVMSSPKVHLKSIGYLAASQSFDQDTDVLMLTTNLLKKDLGSTPADISVTLDGLSHIITQELARDLSLELVSMLKHSRSQIRRRAVLALYKLITKNPEMIQLARPRFEEKLEDPDPSVVAATINVLCELARQNPEDYLGIAPQLFHLLKTSSNNWMVIKIVKLFGSLCPHEPRLVKKLQSPITELISTTPAISLLYECVHTCIIGGMLQGPSGDSLARTCVSKLAAFVQDPDQNLKYIALQAMVKIVPTHPHLVADYTDTIMSSVNDQDISIRMRALELVSAMVNRSNLQSIIQHLLSYLVKENSATPDATQSLLQSASSNVAAGLSPNQSPAYRLVLSQRILAMGSQSTYENITNFEWYLSVLIDLMHVSNVDIGTEIRDQLVDITGRVRAARPFAVKLMSSLLIHDNLIQSAHEPGSCSEVLWAAAWIVGEYCEVLSDPQKLLLHLLRPEVDQLSPDIIAMYIQAVLKIFGSWAVEVAGRWRDDDLTELKEKVNAIITRMRELATAVQHIEVQERASNALQLFTFVSADLNSYQPLVSPSQIDSSTMIEDPSVSIEPTFPKSLYLIGPLFSAYELNTIASGAQASIHVPEGLDLDVWIVPFRQPTPPPQHWTEEKSMTKKGRNTKGKVLGLPINGKKKTARNTDSLAPVTSEYETLEARTERERRKAERLSQLKDDPYYIIDGPSPKVIDDLIPVVHLEDMPPIPHENRLPSLRTTTQIFSSEPFIIDKEGEMPEGSHFQPTLTSDRSTTPAQLTSSMSDPTDMSLKSHTPEPITVVRTKKKGTGGNKKRTAPGTSSGS